MKNGFGFYDYGNPVRTQAGRFGALRAKLLPLLNPNNSAGGHYNVVLTPEDRRRLALWLDMLCPFYGVYEEKAGQAQLEGEKVFPSLE